MGPRTRPTWFDPSIKAVLEGAEAITTARGPRAVEAAAAELLGAELFRVLDEDHDGLWFAWWFEELVAAAGGRIQEKTAGGMPAFWLLHGLMSIGTPALASIALEARDQAPKFLADGVPDWLNDLSQVTATGEVYRMQDDYGTRFAVIAGFSFGRDTDPSMYLFDIDASGFVKLVGAGVFDDVTQAVAAWRAAVGDTAENAHPRLVDDTRELLCLRHCDIGDEAVVGDESRAVMDNWFRAQRRIHEVAEALRKRGKPLPAAESLYHGIDILQMTEPFTAWYADTHGTDPDPEAVGALVEEWMEGALPETWYAVSPRRIRFQRTLISDWIPDSPVTLAVKSLQPDWVRWLSERAGLPDHLRDRVMTALRAV